MLNLRSGYLQKYMMAKKQFSNIYRVLIGFLKRIVGRSMQADVADVCCINRIIRNPFAFDILL